MKTVYFNPDPEIALEEIVEHVVAHTLCPEGQTLDRATVRSFTRTYMRVAGHPDPSDALIDEITDDMAQFHHIVISDEPTLSKQTEKPNAD
jgi:hypothetical protein